MKENDIENFIKDHLDYFDQEVPHHGHESRFMDKLDRMRRRNRLKNRYLFMKMAASFLLLLSITLILLQIYGSRHLMNMKNIDVTISNIEFNEAREYYSDQINQKLEQIKTMTSIESGAKESVFVEISSMDDNVHTLQNELKTNPNDERIMQAIIEHYQIKLNAVNQIIQAFSISQNINKYNQHENNI
jgi:hypothetical protein